VNKARRLAYFTACNIDGSALKAINRDDKTVTDDPTARDLGVESLGAEASDAFRPDPRISIDDHMTRDFYANQIVPGYPNPTSKERIARMFQKGHIVLRSDPAWGLDALALAAERDTFFYTNAAPQVGFFNQGSDLSKPGSKGKLRWRAVETYVLRNALAMRNRVCVFAGPIFDDKDPEYRFGSQIPLKFWKIAVWAEDGVLRAVALVADQGEVLKVMPEGVPQAEAFTDPDEIARVSEFLTTVAAIEAATGLDFGSTVRRADVRAGLDDENVVDGGINPARKRAQRTPKSRKNRRRGP
jgi:endonuclease G